MFSRIEPVEILQLIDAGKAGPSVGVIGFTLERDLEGVAKRSVLLGIDLLHEGVITEDEFRGREVVWLAIAGGTGHGANENAIAIGDGSDDLVGDVVLNLESVLAGDFAVVRFGPKLSATLGIDELHVDADGVAAFADAAFHYVARAQRMTHGADVDGAVFVSHRGVMGDDLKIGKAREACGDVFGQTIGE